MRSHLGVTAPQFLLACTLVLIVPSSLFADEPTAVESASTRGPQEITEPPAPTSTSKTQDKTPHSPDSPQRTESPETDHSGPSIPEQARVFSCSIHFPLNSVQFEPLRVEECFQGIDLGRISYVHVIATATQTGSLEHNLYLSTRRAGALEGYLKVKYPQLQVHAFGGGINPKFGKSARIIIVESSRHPDQEKPGLSQATMVPERPQVKVEVRTEYVHPRKNDVNINWLTGMAQYRPGNDAYQYMGLGVSKNFNAPTLGRMAAGLQYQMFRANPVYDIHAGSVFAEKMWSLHRISKRSRIDLGVQGSVGVDRVTDQNRMTQGGKAMARYVDGDTTGSLEVGLSNHFQWAGLAVGVLI